MESLPLKKVLKNDDPVDSSPPNKIRKKNDRESIKTTLVPDQNHKTYKGKAKKKPGPSPKPATDKNEQNGLPTKKILKNDDPVDSPPPNKIRKKNYGESIKTTFVPDKNLKTYKGKANKKPGPSPKPATDKNEQNGVQCRMGEKNQKEGLHEQNIADVNDIKHKTEPNVADNSKKQNIEEKKGAALEDNKEEKTEPNVAENSQKQNIEDKKGAVLEDNKEEEKTEPNIADNSKKQNIEEKKGAALEDNKEEEKTEPNVADNSKKENIEDKKGAVLEGNKEEEKTEPNVADNSKKENIEDKKGAVLEGNKEDEKSDIKEVDKIIDSNIPPAVNIVRDDQRPSTSSKCDSRPDNEIMGPPHSVEVKKAKKKRLIKVTLPGKDGGEPVIAHFGKARRVPGALQIRIILFKKGDELVYEGSRYFSVPPPEDGFKPSHSAPRIPFPSENPFRGLKPKKVLKFTREELAEYGYVPFPPPRIEDPQQPGPSTSNTNSVPPNQAGPSSISEGEMCSQKSGLKTTDNTPVCNETEFTKCPSPNGNVDNRNLELEQSLARLQLTESVEPGSCRKEEAPLTVGEPQATRTLRSSLKSPQKIDTPETTSEKAKKPTENLEKKSPPKPKQGQQSNKKGKGKKK